MSERLKYALNGIYRCENFAQHLANNDFPEVPIGSAARFDDWFIKLRSGLVDRTYVYLWIYSRNFNKIVRIRCLFCVVKKDGSKSFVSKQSELLKPRYGEIGLDMNVAELLNENNGYMDNGALVIEYGLQVESILEKDKIWRFNTWDPLFDSEEKKNMISLKVTGIQDAPKLFHAHKQLLTFHSSYLSKICDETNRNVVRRRTISHGYGPLPEDLLPEAFQNYLQMVQGVRLRRLKDPIVIIQFAMCHQTWNVIANCERQMIENDVKLPMKTLKLFVYEWGLMRHYMVHFLKDVKSPREMIDKDDIEMMQGETMKMFAAMIFQNKF